MPDPDDDEQPADDGGEFTDNDDEEEFDGENESDGDENEEIIEFNPLKHRAGKFQRYAFFGGKVALAAIGGYAAVRILPPLFWLAARKLPPKVQAPIRRFSPRHERIGQGLLVAGGLSQNPFLLGLGGGMVASDMSDAVLRKRDWIQDKGPAPGHLNFVRYDIPSWLPSHLKYDMIVDILTEIVTKPTWNEEQKVWIPPGREHPDVLAVAREIAHLAGLDGHDKVAVLRAVQSWVQQNIKYVYDPRWLDTYVHPYIVLKQKVGDCDCQSLLTASLAEALGIPMAFILVSQREKGEFTHVLTGGVIDNKLYPVETIFPLSFGQMPEHVEKRVFPLK